MEALGFAFPSLTRVCQRWQPVASSINIHSLFALWSCSIQVGHTTTVKFEVVFVVAVRGGCRDQTRVQVEKKGGENEHEKAYQSALI